MQLTPPHAAPLPSRLASFERLGTAYQLAALPQYTAQSHIKSRLFSRASPRR